MTLESRWLPLLASVLVLGLQAASQGLFIQVEHAEPRGNVAEHMVYALLYHDQLTARGISAGAAMMDLPALRYYPPLMYLATVPFQWLLGRGHEAMLWSTFAFVVVLFVAAYGCARLLLPAFPAWCAAVLASSAPGIVFYERTFYPAVGLAALTLLAIYVMIRSDRLSSLSWTIGLAGVVALGMWHKWTFFIYVAGPALFLIVQCCRAHSADRPGDRRSRLQNLAIGLLLVINMLLPWYAPRAASILFTGQDAFDQHLANRWGGESWSLTAGLRYYGEHVVYGLVGLPLALAALGGCLLALPRRRPDALVLLVLAAVVPPMLFAGHTVLFGRYLLPVVGPAAVLGVVALARLPRVGTGLLALVTGLYAVVPFIWLSPPHRVYEKWCLPTESLLMDHDLTSWLYVRKPLAEAKTMAQVFGDVGAGTVLLAMEDLDRASYHVLLRRPAVSLLLMQSEGRSDWLLQTSPDLPRAPEPDFLLIDATFASRLPAQPGMSEWARRFRSMPLVRRYPHQRHAIPWLGLYRVPPTSSRDRPR